MCLLAVPSPVNQETPDSGDDAWPDPVEHVGTCIPSESDWCLIIRMSLGLLSIIH